MNAELSKEDYWAAGIIEGEGTFYTRKRKSGKVSPIFCCKMTDFDTIQRLSRYLEKRFSIANRIHRCRPQKSWHRESWKVEAEGQKVIVLMMSLKPLLMARRRGRIEEIMAECGK